MATGFDIAKAGWLQRESTVLKRWKKSWVVLDRQGDLRYFESPDHPQAEERIVVRAQVNNIKTGFDCGSISPPERGSKSCMFVLSFTNGEHRAFCAESTDDLKAWQIALEEARTFHLPQNMAAPNMTVVHPVPMHSTTVLGGPMYYSGYPGRVLSAPGVRVAPQTTVYTTNGNATTVITNPPVQEVVYMDSPVYCRRRGYWGPYLW